MKNIFSDFNERCESIFIHQEYNYLLVNYTLLLFNFILNLN